MSRSSHPAQVKQGLPTLAKVLLSIAVKGLILSKCLNYTALPLVCMMCMWIIYSYSLEEEDVEGALTVKLSVVIFFKMCHTEKGFQ